MKNFEKILLSVILAAALCACGNSADNTPAPETPAQTEAAAETEAETEPAPAFTKDENGFSADLTKGYDSIKELFVRSDGWSNGSMFNCTWRKDNCTFDDGKMTLIIDIDKDAEDDKIPYSGAEFRTKNFCGFGYYEVTMKPIGNDGVVSSFFTYTGPSDQNPWDEIDIEFLGKDTTKVQFNYFTDGKGNHEHLCDLGFDAAEEFHNYGFDWKEDSITWYVDGEPVYTADTNIPQTPGRLMMNAWPGTGVDSWLKAFDGNVPLKAEYTAVSYDKNGK